MSIHSINADIVNRDNLTKREAEVFKLLCEGFPDKVIARELAISIKTVEAHIDHIYGKIGVQHQQLNARVAAIATAVARGLVRLSVNALCVLLMAGLLTNDDQAIRVSRVRLRASVSVRRVD